MGPELDPKGKSRTPMDISTGVEGTASKDINKMICAKNCQDNSFLTEASPVEHMFNQSEGPEINVIDKVKDNEKGDAESESEDATEKSSSFGDTDSGTSDGPRSELRDDASSSVALDDFGDLFRTRKKKLTFEWKKFAQPLLWRCKWLELQIRELDAQGLKYEKELAECDRIKQQDLLNLTSEDHSVKCAPMTFQNRETHIMRRMKRKRVEDETDLASYMSNHKIFSTLENRKSFADRPYMDDDFFNSVKPAKYYYIGDDDEDGGWASLGFKDDHRLEGFLNNIENFQLELRTLKDRLDKVISEIPTANVEASNLMNEMPSCSSPNYPETSLCTTSQHTSADEEDVFMPDIATSSYVDITPLQDMAESSERAHFAIPYLKIKDEVMTDLVVKEEPGSECIAKPEVGNGVEDIDDVKPSQQAAKVREVPKISSPKLTRKRSRKKSRINKYSRRSFG